MTMKTALTVVVGTGALLIAAVAAWLSLRAPAPATPPAAAPAATEPAPVAAAPDPAASAGPDAAAPAPAIQYPIAAAEPEPAASAAPPDLDAVLTDLFGRAAVLALFQREDFVARVVATVDNLGRAKAAARLWPLDPAEGRFTVVRQGDGEAIGADNAARYARHVALLENVDPARLVAAYRRLYPRFQQAYEALGYPGRYFNDRLVEVIDILLATPEVAPPVLVRRPEIKGPLQPQRPWVLYEFEDPALRALPAGSKILLRMGPGHAARVKARLAELRALLVQGAPRR